MARPRADAFHAHQLLPVTLRGRVIAPDSTPVSGVSITVAGTTRRTATSATGDFRLALAVGRWTLHLRRLGFASGTVHVALADTTPHDMVIVLHPATIELATMQISGDAGREFRSVASGEALKRVPALAEPDVFRALAVLPNVTVPNDLTGAIHLAGGAGDETGITLDGHPLVAPFHLAGLLGAFNVAALEDATVHLGVLPADYVGRLGGVIEMTTRRPHGVAESEARLGVLAGGFTTLRPIAGEHDLLFSVRSSYLDRLAERIARLSGDDDILVPAYGDAMLRAGVNWGRESRTEVLGFATRDSRRSLARERSIAPPEVATQEYLLGARHAARYHSFAIRGRFSVNRALADQRGGNPTFAARVDNSHDWISGNVMVDRRSGAGTATFGVNVDRQSARTSWSNSSVWRRPGTPTAHEGMHSQLQWGGLGEWRANSDARWRPVVGVRTAAAGGQVYMAPRVSLSTTAGAIDWRVAYERRHQFESELGNTVEWTLPQPRFPLKVPRRVQSGSLQGVWRPRDVRSGDGVKVMVAGELFARRYEDRTALADRCPDVSDAVSLCFPAFERVNGSALGGAMGATAIFRRASLQVAYTYNDVTERRADGTAPPDWHIRQSLAAMASASPGWGWHLTSALHARDGAVATPVLAHIFAPFGAVDPHAGMLLPRYVYGDRNSGRLAPYYRVDFGLRREWRMRGALWSGSLMALNVLNRRNALSYEWSRYFCISAGRCGGSASRTSLPIVPSISFDVRW